MWLKVLLLLFCLFILFVISRIVESTLFLETGFHATSMVDPVTLGVRELKKILKFRGVSYVGVLEKQELTNLVLSSGQLCNGEVSESNSVEEENNKGMYSLSTASDKETTYFTFGSHFYEEVEDTKDSVWLLQVIPTHSHLPLLDDYNWKQVRNRLKPFGIRTGVFSCHLDPKLCKRKGWFDRQLVLALPQGVHPKDNIVYETFSTSTKSGSAVHWVRNALNSRLKVVKTHEQLENVWLNFDSCSELSTKVRILLVLPENMEPPLFYSSLSTKFSGRVTFGVVRDLSATTNVDIFKDLDKSKCNYVVITPERVFRYGDHVGEHLNLRRLELMLRSLQPEMNDIFIWSLITVNILLLFDVFLVYDKMWKHVVRCFWIVVKRNFFLLIFWLLILSMVKFSFVDVLTDYLLRLTRFIGTLEVASVLRNDFVYWKCHWYVFPTLFTVLCATHFLVRRRWFPQTLVNDDGDFVTVLTNLFFPPPFTLRRPTILDREIAQEMDQLLERLAMPNLWLQPAVSRLDYLYDLPVWKHSVKNDEVSDKSSCNESETEQHINVNVNVPQSSRVNDTECCVDTCNGCISKFTKFVAKFKRQLRVLRQKKRTQPLLKKQLPAGMVPTLDCAICLESYVHNEVICGLPCGHNYHQRCVLGWILRDHHHCPSCRFPTNGRESFTF